MKKYTELVNEVLPHIKEIFPWDLEAKLRNGDDVLLVDIREPHEYESAHVSGSLNVPRGVLESSCDWGYQETVPELASARARPVVLMCKSGNRSALAAYVMQLMGYQAVASLKTGLRGWNDAEQALVGKNGLPVSTDDAEQLFTDHIGEDQQARRDTR